MKRWGALLAALVLCGILAACGGREGPTESGEAEKTARREARTAYAAALETLLKDRVLPDGTPCPEAWDGDLSTSTFAVFDVDGDGEEELLLLYDAGCMAGMAGYVFAWDGPEEPLRTELQEFPALTVYDNGYIQADWSHNQGLAGEFWPYNLYRYDPETDQYALLAMVDAWDRRLAETNEQGQPFPAERDRSGTGVVYFVMTEGAYDTTEPMDAADYAAWREGLLGGAGEMEPPALPLTAENVRKLLDGGPET